MVNVRTLSFARAMHHEATGTDRLAGLPVLKGTGAYSVPQKPAAPGEVPVKALSDEGSTPSISTKKRTCFSAGPFSHEIHFCATRKISSAGNICAANAKSAGCFAQCAECAVFLHAGAFFAQNIQTHCNILPYATARTSQELRLIKMSPYAFLAIILAAGQKTPSGEQSK